MTRSPLPNRRQNETFEVFHKDLIYFASVGLYPDGSLGEVFVQAAKTSTLAEWLARDAAILISLAMQFGCPLETMRRTVTREEDGGPSTVVGALLDVLAGRIESEDRKEAVA